jgi:hypothetical protein
MLGVIYLAIGALVGVAVSKPVSGAVIILSIWMLDVVVGPAAGSLDKVFTCWFPTHCHSLWMVDMPSHHAGRLADVGIALVRVVRALVVAGAVVATGSRTAWQRPRTSGQLPSALRRPSSGLGMPAPAYWWRPG